VFWSGEPFDLVYGEPASATQGPSVSDKDPSKWPQLYPSLFDPAWDPFSQPATMATQTTPYEQLSDLTLLRTTFAPAINALAKHGATAIGSLDQNGRS